MNRSLIFLSFTLIFIFSCTSISEDKLDLLNGYWEIETVEFPNGGKKEYKMNTDIEFIQLDGLKGFRKKMKPRFDGSYETSDDAEPFELISNEKVFSLHYKNDLSEWKETLTSLTADNFTVKNEDGILYHYKRFEPINIESTP
ncbi:hypothetical protein ACFQZJ_14015 [Maribacter chungangensis]|uniref:Lipocalin-like domain-containing protein n=1 Tax=Maribacter chungangensis TaxID=1069117 RepID=A0ABW3B7M0_9FLAO